jgi:DeoR family transcriptional regulator, glycerol-3-phosphate regulon repressor
MQLSKRHSEILRILREEGTCTIIELSQRLSVSLETIRRDIKPLAHGGEVLKMHGAVALPYQVGEAPFERRMRENAAAKRAIARQAASHIRDGDSVMLDTGTTTSLLARELLKKRGLTIVTNSSDIARTLATVNGDTVFMAGGELHGDNGAAFGPSAIEFIQRFKVHHAIISIGAVDIENGMMDYRLDEAEFAATVLSRGDNAMIISDHTKFGRSGLVKVCEYSEVDILITDTQPDGEFGDVFDSQDVKVEVAQI